MLIGLLAIFNIFLVFIFASIIVQLVKGYENNTSVILIIIFSCVVIAFITFLFQSKVGEVLLRFIGGGRKAITRERNKLEPIIDRIQASINEKMGRNKLRVHLLVIDDPLPNACAIGRNTISVTRGLLETTSDAEIAGVLAHEFGHLHSGDSKRLGITLGLGYLSLILTFFAGVAYAFFRGISSACDAGQGECSLFMKLFSWVFIILSFILLAFIKVGNWTFNIALLAQGRKQEFKADEFAMSCGFGKGLLDYLERIKDFDFSGNSIASKIFATHPAVMLRIDELEKALGHNVN